MRVALLQSETRFIGGIERVTEGILQYNCWKDVDWHCIFLRPGVLVERVRAFFPHDRTAVLNAGRLRDMPRTILTISQVARQLRKWKIDAVVSQGFHAQSYGGWAARLAGARNVFWCHNLLRPEHEGHDRVVRLALRAPTDVVLGAPASNIVNLEHYYASRCPVRLVYPSHPMDHFAGGDGARIRKEFNIPASAPVAVIVGRLQPWKGQNVFVRAAARVAEQVPEACFLVVGGGAMEGDAAYEVQLRTLARDLGIDDRVIFTGERADVPDLLAAADVAVHCSVDPEPFGLVILEAMAAGRAVIASNAGGPAEIIEAGNSGLLTRPGDHAELGEAMLRVLTDRELRGRLARNGAARLESRFSFRRMASDLTSILHGIRGGRRLPGAAGSELSRRAQ